MGTEPEQTTGNDLRKRTKDFAHRCIKLSLALPETDLGNHIRRQLIKCSTSVASNYRATCVAQSKADFASKLSIVVEEADESCFWMEFIIEEGLLNEKQVVGLLKEGKELTAIFVKSRKTTKDRSSEFGAED
jgi:four helix bundle protein